LSAINANHNKKFRFQKHEAIALEKESIGDRLHLDIVSSIPVNSEGILTLVEGVTTNGLAFSLIGL
jgi:hypothetical protein